MTMKKSLKKIIAYMAIIGIITSAMCVNVFATASAELPFDKFVELKRDSFDGQSVAAWGWGKDTLGGKATNYIAKSYVQDNTTNTKDYALKLNVTSTSVNKSYHGNTTYQTGAFSVNYTPLNVTGNYYASLYFRVLNHNKNYYRVNLYENKIVLRARVGDASGSYKTYGSATYSSLGLGDTLSKDSEYEIKVSFDTVDSTNYFKVWINNKLAINYSGATTAIESNANYSTRSYLGVGLYGAVDNAETTDVDESTAALFDDFVYYQKITDRTFNGNTDFSSTQQGPYWYYMSRQYTEGGKISGNLTQLAQYSDYSKVSPWYYGWDDVKGGVAINGTYMKPSAKTDYLSAVKVFKAPCNGIITIGASADIVLQHDDAVDTRPSYIQITRNNEVVWPSTTDAEWVKIIKTSATTFTPVQIRVSKGDEIGFVVWGESKGWAWQQITNWTPTVKYDSVEALGIKADLTDGQNKYSRVSAIRAAGADEAKTVKIDVTTSCNNGETEQPSSVVAALYNADGKLLKADIHANLAMTDGETEKYTLNLGTTDDVPSGSYIRVFLLQDINEPDPIMETLKIN